MILDVADDRNVFYNHTTSDGPPPRRILAGSTKCLEGLSVSAETIQ